MYAVIIQHLCIYITKNVNIWS